jgi:hypothetical protein
MMNLRFIIYLICFCIFLHFVFYFFNVDVFELFEKKTKQKHSTEIDNTIIELEKQMQELKDISHK